MKRKAIKFFLPTMASMIAIVASAFTAIDEPMVDDNLTITGYYPSGNAQQPCNSKQVECDFEGQNVCTIEGVTYYAFYNGTLCQTELRKNNIP